MKCVGKECPRFFEGDGYRWCQELQKHSWINEECMLLKNIQEVRDDLIRKCRLFEELLDATDEDDLRDVIDWSNELDV